MHHNCSLQNGGYEKPRKGKKNDKAHPPIHPTAHVGNLAGDDKKVYEYITRRFLACCSKDAEGFQTTVDVVAGGDEFSAVGATPCTDMDFRGYNTNNHFPHRSHHFRKELLARVHV